MHADGQHGRTRLLAYGGVACIGAAIAGFFVAIAAGDTAADVALGAIGTLLVAEGSGLITNWHGGADEVVDIIRGRPPVTESVVAMYLGKAWFIRGFVGLGAAVIGAAFWFAAVHGPAG